MRNHFELNSIKAKLKETITVAIYRPATHTTVKAAKNTRYKNPQFVAQHEKICCVINEEQSQNWLLKEDRRSTFRNNFPQPTLKDQRTFLLRDKLITQGEKREKLIQNSATKQCWATRWRILYLISPPLLSYWPALQTKLNPGKRLYRGLVKEWTMSSVRSSNSGCTRIVKRARR